MAEDKILTHRYVARYTVEATTPLFVGSGKQGLLVDMVVQRDHLGLPMILGTSLAGVLRHAMEDSLLRLTATDDGDAGILTLAHMEDMWGYQRPKRHDRDTKDNGRGSRLHVSSAYLMLSESQCSQGLLAVDDEVYDTFRSLPARQHVRIDHKGTAEDGGLFNNEVVYKGTRFRFEIELDGTAADLARWEVLTGLITNHALRVGAGTRNGYGSLKVVEEYHKMYNLQQPDDLNAYLALDPHLDSVAYHTPSVPTPDDKAIHYQLQLTPDDFFHFGTGSGDTEVDLAPLTEQVVSYQNKDINVSIETVIPGSSIKGAISHRTAYHYNRLCETYADKLSQNEKTRNLQLKLMTGVGNDAVYYLFGGEAGLTDITRLDNQLQEAVAPREGGHRGHVIIDDIYLSGDAVDNSKIFNHVAIDRFTGGAMDGALFSEKVSRLKGNQAINIDIHLDLDQQQIKNLDEYVLPALEAALHDVCTGLLPLGGLVTKGHGMFTGTLVKNNDKIYSYE